MSSLSWRCAITALQQLLLDLQNTPDDRRVIVRSLWDWTDPPVDHYREFLTTAGELRAALTGTPIPDPVRKVTVTAAVLNVRSGAGTQYAIVGTLRAGEIVEIEDKPAANGYYRLTANNRVQGWISTQWVK